MHELLGVSVIVLNYNYGRFLAVAIDSALNQDHPLCEVIVVDDGSTDNSRAVIARYGDRIRSVLQETSKGQVSALNSAWPLARQPILIFLDADDLLFPHAAATVARRWTPTTVKTQSRLVTIDEAGRQFGHIAPKYPPNLNTTTIRKQLLRTGGSYNCPASGNAYSRALLDRMTLDGAFDFENPREYHMDAILECNAPFYGEVVTIYEPLAYYRVHGRNMYATSQVNEAHFTMLLDTFTVKLNYLAQRCKILGIPFDRSAARFYSVWPLECRLCANKLTSAKYLRREPTYYVLFRLLRAYFYDRVPVSNRVIRAAWSVNVALSPRAVARCLIALRFVAAKRPLWLERLLTEIINITARRGWWSRRLADREAISARSPLSET